jgi:FSR family fosmidomycin resistance protein-like MFS transporter
LAKTDRIRDSLRQRFSVPVRLAALFLTIAFLDELVFGAVGAAWPALRNDLGLTYVQIGLLSGLPVVIGNLIEPALGLLGDTGHRKRIIFAGGLCFCLAALLIGAARSFPLLLAAFILFYPSSGAFVSLSQATLMDGDPGRRELSMARWTLAGSLGAMAGPILLALVLSAGGSWRVPMVFFAAAALLSALALLPKRFPRPSDAVQRTASRTLFSAFRSAVRRREVVRWLALLVLGDLMLDVLMGFLALYAADIAALSPAAAGWMVALWSGTGILGDALLIPLLQRADPVRWLRISAVCMAGLYAGFLLAPWIGVKCVLLAFMGLLHAGWYAIPQARLYAALPGRSGTAMAVSSAFGFLAGGIPLMLGILAQQSGLAAAMWLLMAGPWGLLILLPSPNRSRTAGGWKTDDG